MSQRHNVPETVGIGRFFLAGLSVHPAAVVAHSRPANPQHAVTAVRLMASECVKFKSLGTFSNQTM